MAKDPAFLFYPGDYLKDTQCLSEKSQVAYDRIMCEHMRNISTDMSNIIVSSDRVNFFIKRLSDEEKEEIMHVMKKVEGGYQIEWVALSMSKRKSYTNSRAENRSHKNKSDMCSYDEHMENANEIDNIVKLKKNGKAKTGYSGVFKARGEETAFIRLQQGLEAANKNGIKDFEG